MVTYRYPLIAREAWLIIAVLVAVAIVVQYFSNILFAIPVWLLTAVVTYLFRDPSRKIPPKPLAVVSPVDGVVVTIEESRNPYIDGSVTKIQLRMGFSDVYTVRSPMEGKVLKQWFPKSGVTQAQGESHTERFAQWVQSDEDDDVILAFKPTTFLKRPHCYVHSGERVGQGQRCGIVPFGATVEVYLPTSARIEAQMGHVVKAGSDTLATLVHSY